MDASSFELTLAGVKMRTAAAAKSGVVSSETVLRFEQSDQIFSAHYSGGPILCGYLIGKFETRGSVQFRYVQADEQGNLDTGVSKGTLSRLVDGRLRLVEEFQWLTRPGGGQNVFEEM